MHLHRQNIFSTSVLGGREKKSQNCKHTVRRTQVAQGIQTLACHLQCLHSSLPARSKYKASDSHPVMPVCLHVDWDSPSDTNLSLQSSSKRNISYGRLQWKTQGGQAGGKKTRRVGSPCSSLLSLQITGLQKSLHNSMNWQMWLNNLT